MGVADNLNRPETEAYTTQIACLILENLRNRPLQSKPNLKFRILDLCTGTGCISLLLYAKLFKHIPQLEILGVDVSSKAIELADENLQHNINLGHLPEIAHERVHFQQADIFRSPTLGEDLWDLVISNPPYISPRSFNKDTSISVRNYEPKIALVPLDSQAISTESKVADRDLAIGDAFYPKLLDIAQISNAGMLLVEVADMDQASRVVTQAVRRHYWGGFEIWRDWPDGITTSDSVIDGAPIKVIGEGHGRSVLVWKSGRRLAFDVLKSEHRI